MRKSFPFWAVILAPIVAALLNVFLNWANRSLGSPLFADSIFTAVVAAVFGVVPGLAAALLTQLGMEAVLSLQGPFGTALPFVFCGFATALIVGLAAERGRFLSVLALTAVIAGVTLANSVIGSVTATFVFGGVTLHTSDFLITGFLLSGQQLLEASFWARVPLNLIDKGIAVGLAYFTLKQLVPKQYLPAPRG
ncbi:MAG: hypothetical protein WCG80_05685 [Spirochaetales bacterium]